MDEFSGAEAMNLVPLLKTDSFFQVVKTQFVLSLILAVLNLQLCLFLFVIFLEKLLESLKFEWKIPKFGSWMGVKMEKYLKPIFCACMQFLKPRTNQKIDAVEHSLGENGTGYRVFHGIWRISFLHAHCEFLKYTYLCNVIVISSWEHRTLLSYTQERKNPPTLANFPNCLFSQIFENCLHSKIRVF